MCFGGVLDVLLAVGQGRIDVCSAAELNSKRTSTGSFNCSVRFTIAVSTQTSCVASPGSDARTAAKIEA